MPQSALVSHVVLFPMCVLFCCRYWPKVHTAHSGSPTLCGRRKITEDDCRCNIVHNERWSRLLYCCNNTKDRLHKPQSYQLLNGSIAGVHKQTQRIWPTSISICKLFNVDVPSACSINNTWVRLKTKTTESFIPAKCLPTQIEEWNCG
jgi:hypothetical protein